MIRYLYVALLTAILTILLASPALAHKTYISVYATSGVIHTESCFAGKHPVTQGTIEVRKAGNDELLLTGTTDSEGKFSFPISKALRKQKPDLLIIIKAGAGHRSQVRMPAAQYLAAI